MKKKIAQILIFLLIIQLIPWEGLKVYADEQEPPLELSVDEADGKPIIAYTPGKGNYVRLKWNTPSWSGDTQYYELYYAEDGQAYKKYVGEIPRTETSIELEELKAGTVYHVYLKAIHEHYDENGNFESKDESTTSNEVIFCTNMDLVVSPGGNSTLEVQWTDTIYRGRRLDYNLYISESKSFGQTSPLYIRETNIGVANTVKPVDGKLIYKASDLKSGTIYYIKIKPIINDERVVRQEESKIVSGYTNILATISKVSADWWKLEWNQITNSNLDQNQEIIYKIKRCIEGDLEKEISATKDTQMFIKLVGDNTYYRIQADVETELEETISVISDEIYPKEIDTPITPIVPEVVDELSDEKMEVGPNSLIIIWKAPQTITGEIDKDILYDIWMLTDPDDINDSAVSPTVSNLQMSPENYIYEMVGSAKSDRIIGYKYTVNSLSSNKIYYLKMVAKKNYIINESGTLINKDFCSEPALKVIITPPDGSINQPVAPAKPPLKVKTEEVEGKIVQVVTPTTATLQWKNRWSEVWRDVYGAWQYIPEEDLQQASVQGEVYRSISYDSSTKFSVGYEVYTDDFDFTRLSEIVSPMPMQFNDIPNSTNSDIIEYMVENLTPNTTYVMWIRAYNSNFLKSGLSDPIIVTTKPEFQIPAVKPAIPIFNYKFEGDDYLEIGWDIKDDYNYSIKYSTEDNFEQASQSIELTSEQIRYKTKYTLEGLTPNTVYYFWIRAEIKDANGISLTSQWSDSYSVKTTPYSPPEVPSGFGLKNITEPIGIDYIFYEWVKVDELEYTLETGKKDDFSDAKVYELNAVTEYKVGGLESNTRYFARLYVYDPKKQLKSKYTGSISAVTKKSNEEYYTDADLNSAVINFIKPVLDKNKIAVLDITQKNIDIFIEQIYKDSNINYVADFFSLTTEEVKKSNTKISPRVLTALGQMKKTLTLDNGKAAIVIKPSIMNNKQLRQLYENYPQSIVEITFEKTTELPNRPSGASTISEVWQTSFGVNNGGSIIPITEITDALKLKIPYSKSDWYDKATMSGYIYDDKAKAWLQVNTMNTFDKTMSKGFVYADIPGTSKFVIMKAAWSRFSDIYGHPAEADIMDITNKYNLKTLGSETFQPNKSVTKGEAVKIILDIMNYEYDNNYLDTARKAQITQNINLADTNSNVTREEAAAMITRIYELKTGKQGQSNLSLANVYDAGSINSNLLPRVRFAIDNGTLAVNSAGLLKPKDLVSRAQMMVMLKKMLVYAGEL